MFKFLLISLSFISFGCKAPMGGNPKFSAPETVWDSLNPTSDQRCDIITDEGVEVRKPFILKSAKTEGQWHDSWVDSMYKDFEGGGLDPLLNKEIRDSDLEAMGCPNYGTMNKADKKRFYILLTASMAYAESSFKTNTCYDEGGGTHDSFGLTQIDASNMISSGCTDRSDLVEKGVKMMSRAELNPYRKGKYLSCKGENLDSTDGYGMYHPELNLRCTLYKLQHQVTKQKGCAEKGAIFCGKKEGGSYWAVLRPERDGHSTRLLPFIKKHLSQIKNCKNPAVGQQDEPGTLECKAQAEAAKINNSARADKPVSDSVANGISGEVSTETNAGNGGVSSEEALPEG